MTKTGRVRSANPPGELARLAAYLDTGRLSPPSQHAATDAHIALLERLLERAAHMNSMLEALLRTLAGTLAHPHALRRLASQFPQRQLAAIVRAAAPGHHAALLDVFAEVQGATRLQEVAADASTVDAWCTVLKQALAGRASKRITQPAAEAGAVIAATEAAWRAGQARPEHRASLERLLLHTPATELVAAVPERLRESLLRFAVPAMAAELLALLHAAIDVGRCVDDCWVVALEACQTPSVLAIVRARLDGLPIAGQSAQDRDVPCTFDDQLSERQMRAMVLRALPEGGAEVLKMVLESHRAGAMLHVDPASVHRAIWPVLLDVAANTVSSPESVRARLARALLTARGSALGERAAHDASIPGREMLQALIDAGSGEGATRSELHLIADAVIRRARTRAGYPVSRALAELLTGSTPDDPVRLRERWLGGRAPAELRAVSVKGTVTLWQAGAALAPRRLLQDLRTDGAGWLARIRTQLAGDARVPPARQKALVDAIADAATASGRQDTYLRLALQTLAGGAALDLEAIGRATNASSVRPAIVHALRAGAGGPAWTALVASDRDVVARIIRQPAWRRALAHDLPEPMLADLVDVMAPTVGAAMATLLDGGAVLAPILGVHWRRALWQAAIRQLDKPTPPDQMQIAILRAAAGTTPRAQADLVLAWQSRSSTEPVASHPGATQGERIFVGNAGMVLMAPYLPRLFGMLGLLHDGGFIDTAAAERASLLLQFAVSGETDAPEYQLPLNKLLCGLPLDAPVPARVDLRPAERETIDGLLGAMIASWSALGRTSIDGLRQAFLVRDGELELEGEMWRLAVVAGPFDMLMDRLPWSFSIVKFAWMPLPLHVTWH